MLTNKFEYNRINAAKFLLYVLLLTGLSGKVWAGSLDAPAAPTDPSSAMFTLQDVCNRLNNGTAGSKRTGAFTEPTAAPAPTDCTIDEIMAKARPAATAKTGQTTCFNPSDNVLLANCENTGQDGEFATTKGAGITTRFTDNMDGTIIDNLTGLIWLKNAQCSANNTDWKAALEYIVDLNTNGTMNSNDCTDTSNAGSHQTDWRLPNLKELQTLIDLGQYNPTLPNGHPFLNVVPNRYWSSTTDANHSGSAWIQEFQQGEVRVFVKSHNYAVWPVRGGQ